MTASKFDAMDEREQRDAAKRLADTSDVFDFETALEVVKLRPAEAERLLQMREEMAKHEEERVRRRERRRRALIEDFG